MVWHKSLAFQELQKGRCFVFRNPGVEFSMWVRGTCATEAPLQDMATGIDEVRGTCAAEALVCAGAPLNIS